MYSGDGTVAAGWPDQTAWVTFQTMWAANVDARISKCGNSEAETAGLLQAISTEATSSGVDGRFILAVVIQESNGCVRAPSTFGSVRNPGLMQSYQGIGSCADPVEQNPCPYSEIKQMIQDGTEPNESGYNLGELIQTCGKTDVSKYYTAARMYNSGQLSLVGTSDLSSAGATTCYASDIANRLVGYLGNSCGEP